MGTRGSAGNAVMHVRHVHVSRVQMPAGIV